eukprot:1158513-Pelagomonas_calceolata.AAC.8
MHFVICLGVLRKTLESWPSFRNLHLCSNHHQKAYICQNKAWEAPLDWARGLGEDDIRPEASGAYCPAAIRIESELRDFVLGGVALEGAQKERFNEIQQELAQLSTKFSNNVSSRGCVCVCVCVRVRACTRDQGKKGDRLQLANTRCSRVLNSACAAQVLDATKAFKKLVTAKEDVEGLPESALGLAAQAAAKEGHPGATPEAGPWMFTLDFPSYFPVRVLRHCQSSQESHQSAWLPGKAFSSHTKPSCLLTWSV